MARHRPDAAAIRLCAVADYRGEDVSLGLIRLSDFHRTGAIWLPAIPSHVGRIRVGMAIPEALATKLLPVP
jgi:hypothetical protein